MCTVGYKRKVVEREEKRFGFGRGYCTSHPCQVSGLIELVLTILAREPSKPYKTVDT